MYVSHVLLDGTCCKPHVTKNTLVLMCDTALARAHTRIHTRTHTYTYTHMYTHVHTYTHTHTHTHAPHIKIPFVTYTHTHAHAHAYTHTHTSRSHTQRTSHVTINNESRMSRLKIDITLVTGSYESVTPCDVMSHVTRTNESCHN